jgi:hypothetical protein
MAVDIRRLEIERIENLVRNFGWETDEIKHPPGEIVITFKKKIEETGSPEAGGPQ